MPELYLFLTGIFGGFLAGFLGIGGGILYIFILPLFLNQFGFEGSELVRYTIANSIVCTLIASISGNIAQLRFRRFYKREVLLVGVFGIIASLATLKLVVFSDWYSKELFDVFLVTLLVFILIQTLRRISRKFRFVREVIFDFKKLSLAGLSGGFIAGATGLGGGAIIVPLLNLGLKMNIKKAKSISLGVLFITSLAISIYNSLAQPIPNEIPLHLGYIIIPVVVPISLGVLLSTPAGVWVSRKSPSFFISYIFSGFLFLVILRKSWEIYHWLI